MSRYNDRVNTQPILADRIRLTERGGNSGVRGCDIRLFQTMKDITDYILRFYNEGRLHSTLGYVSPNQYE